MAGELFDVYDANDRFLGFALRSECHGNPKLLHHTAHVVVFHPGKRAILLQKRALTKDIQPGKWDTAVGGHLRLGESYEAGAVREMAEELGVEAGKLEFLFDSRIRNEVESENVRVFGIHCAGPFRYQAEEIDEVRFWDAAELQNAENRKTFTPNLIKEIDMLFSQELL